MKITYEEPALRSLPRVQAPDGGGSRDARFWRWYVDHADDVILRAGWLFLRVEIRVRDLRPIFERIFGPAPAGTP